MMSIVAVTKAVAGIHGLQGRGMGGSGERCSLIQFGSERLFDFFAWKPPLPSRTRMRPFPVTPYYDTRTPGRRWGDDYNFPGGGINNHQPTEQWASTSVQQAEASTSLAAAKPNFTENSNQSEVSDYLPR